MLETYQFKTQCKEDIHSSKTANIILLGLMPEYRRNALTCTSEVLYSNSVTWVVSTSIHGCIWTSIRFCTRNSAIADKPRHAFRGQSRSPNMVPFRMLRMVSYFCAIVILSNFEIFDFTNVVTLKTELGVRQSHWKYHHLMERTRLPINDGSTSCSFWDIQCLKITEPWNPGQGSIKLIKSGTIR